jgi:hypothetical protein
MPLFQERIEALAKAVENLPDLVEAAQGRWFVGKSIERIPMWLSRDEVSEVEWRDLCEAQGQDPNSEQIPLPQAEVTIENPIDAGSVPPRPLVTLIGAYALADGDMGELLRALHPNPSEADGEKLSRLLYARRPQDNENGLMRKAEQVATLVRGGKTGRGAPPRDLSSYEYLIACEVTRYRECGWSEDRIYQQLGGRTITRKKLAELGSLRLRWLDD